MGVQWFLLAMCAAQILSAHGQCCEEFCSKLSDEQNCERGNPNEFCPADANGKCQCIWRTTGDFVNYYCLSHVIEEDGKSGVNAEKVLIILLPTVFGLCFLTLLVCWCGEYMGGYHEEELDAETGMVKIVRRSSVTGAAQRVIRRMSAVCASSNAPNADNFTMETSPGSASMPKNAMPKSAIRPAEKSAGDGEFNTTRLGAVACSVRFQSESSESEEPEELPTAVDSPRSPPSVVCSHMVSVDVSSARILSLPPSSVFLQAHSPSEEEGHC
eukprot:CAMPEP_0181296144 /NCGR_PEP_ID=MMETSP1101-20121128/4538_1 /TAXON_ID=46948 /ORGANISM="Rhodomonas abbreviata, Strain Caron Lab Isolate" /LENGTH=270 /DNA_ID=CAMNT_0023400971 /DNA_START=279 /DNA_END=1091 /DNA_ORIENTATION=+